ncbi:MAG: DivIVA domain-containing protein [Oscillospiraceae bacterium]|nr:DivIVA domain-containing protein [Oscillospiraceae bacterium]
MFTPQQIDQISFGKATFGGYNMDDVDEFLEPLCEDYVTLYKENALLKSKMRVLVGKLEEYRKNEAAMKEAVAEAKKTCDKMVHEAEVKCEKILSEANTAAAQNVQDTGALVAAEAERVEEARKLAASKIDEIQEQMRSCIQALDRIKLANQPKAEPAPVEVVTTDADAVADEISKNLESLVGTTEDIAPKAAPQHPVHDTTTAKFANLQFGRNYDVNHK